MMTYKEAFKQWSNEIKPGIIEMYGENDYPALAESWSAYTDMLTEQGDFNQLMYHYCPAHDDNMPDNDIEYLLECLDVDIDIVAVNERPDYNHPDIYANHYWFSINRADTTITGYFSAGSACGYPNESEIIAAVFMDFQAYENTGDIDTFFDEYGYDKPSAAMKAFEGCERYYNAINEMFSDNEQEGLQELFNEM